MSQAKEKLNTLNKRFGGLFKAAPDTMTAFRGLTDVATKEGALSPAMKELIAVAIAVSKGCEDCIIYHISGALKHGAERGQLVEILSVAVEMAGGPGAVYAARALEAFDELAD